MSNSNATHSARSWRSVLTNPAWVCFTWFGMTAGVSLLATPIKFTATLLTRPAALEVGKVTFQLLNKAELVALILLLVTVRVSGQAARWWAFCAVVTLIVLAQSAWLLPELAARADMVAQNQPLPESPMHAIYSTLELTKLLLLLGAGFAALRQR